MSHVLHIPAASPMEANRHFLMKLSVETDVADVRLDLESGDHYFVLLDARNRFIQERSGNRGVLLGSRLQRGDEGGPVEGTIGEHSPLVG